MTFINTIFGIPLGYIIYLAYQLTGNFAVSVLIFAFIVRLVLLPVNIITHKNSIRLLRLQPQLSKLKRRYAADREALSAAQYELFKKEKYSPMLGLIPLFIQLIILIGVLQVMYHPMQHILHLTADEIALHIQTASAISSPGLPEGAGVQLSAAGLLSLIDLSFLGINMGAVPSLLQPSIELLVPPLSGISAFLYCLAQNALSPGALSQSRRTNLFLTLFTVAFSIYFTFVTPSGVGIYWTAANILSIGIIYLLELLYSPKKLAYDAVAHIKQTQKTPAQLRMEREQSKALKFREKQDAARFKKAKKELVFYSLSGGQYKYYKTTIDYLLEHSDIDIHYLTNDPNDAVFNHRNPRLIPYYAGHKKTISLLLRLDADMMVTTVQDLQIYHMKRSVARDDIEYVHIPHGPGSLHLTARETAYDHFDTFFCAGPHQAQELRRREEIAGLKKKNLVKAGYGLYDELVLLYNSAAQNNSATPASSSPPTPQIPSKTAPTPSDAGLTPSVNAQAIPQILIAPSWQDDSILDICIDSMLESLLGRNYKVIVRPHPQYLRIYPERIEELTGRYTQSIQSGELIIDTDFSDNSPIFLSDILITDWSGIALEFSYCTLKPSIFINTPMKILNPNYESYGLEALDISLRTQIGVEVSLEEITGMHNTVDKLLEDKNSFKAQIEQVVEKYIYYPGRSGEAGGKYITGRLRGETVKDG